MLPDFLNSGVLVAVIAHGLIGISLLWDKVLLGRAETKNLLSYVFWLGALGVFGLLLAPFGFHTPSPEAAVLAFVSGIIEMAAAYYYYAALKHGEASQTLAIMGGFSPVATALIGQPLLKSPLPAHELPGFTLLVAGGFLMFFAERLDIGKVLPEVLLASVLFGLTNVMQKMAFERENFVTAYVFITLGMAAAAAGMLAPRTWRRQILGESERAEPRSRFWYLVNRVMAGVGGFLVYYAISLASPAVVDAITAVRYVIIFLGAWLITRIRPAWLRENFAGLTLAGKIVATLLVVAGLVLLALRGGSVEGGPT